MDEKTPGKRRGEVALSKHSLEVVLSRVGDLNWSLGEWAEKSRLSLDTINRLLERKNIYRSTLSRALSVLELSILDEGIAGADIVDVTPIHPAIEYSPQTVWGVIAREGSDIDDSVQSELNIHDIWLTADAVSRLAEDIAITQSKAESLPKNNTGRLNISVEVSDDASVDDAAKEIAALCQALNAYHIACGGKGLTIDDWESLVLNKAFVGV
ncbi:MAG: hypothetical protein AAGB19_02800 [Cyanobacteria bacterium P01_F01_bin.3]